MLNIAIVDDDAELCSYIKKEIDIMLINDDVEYRTHTLGNAEHLFKIMNSISFDIILLDIDMPGINGIQTAELLRNNNYHAIIIFVTSKISYMPEAFGLNVFSFIDKKDIENILPDTLTKCINTIDKSVSIVLKTNDGSLRLSKDDIIYATIEDRKVAIFTAKEKHLVNLPSLHQLCELLQSKSYVYIKRNTIINLAYLLRIKKKEIFLKHIPTPLSISNDKYKEINTALLEWISNRGIL